MSQQEKSTSRNVLCRRGFLSSSSALVATATLGLSAQQSAWGQASLAASAPFSLPALPYDYDALNPVIDTQTMTIHHTKHHQGYVDKLNAAVSSDAKLSNLTLKELLVNLDRLPESVQTSVRNNGGGHANHSLFWTVMKPSASESQPTGKLAEAIDSTFGSFANFKTAFSTAGATQFGSGWAWLAVEKGSLKVLSTPNQDSPIAMGMTPILGLDVWEHAYYLKYQNRRADYIEAFWKLVNWDQVTKYMAAA